MSATCHANYPTYLQLQKEWFLLSMNINFSWNPDSNVFCAARFVSGKLKFFSKLFKVNGWPLRKMRFGIHMNYRDHITSAFFSFVC